MQPLLQLYRLAKSTGALNTGAGEAVFRRAYFAYKKHLEDPHEKLARANPDLFAGGHVLDVGANIGYTAALFARFTDLSARVYAFEPEAWNFAALQHTIAALALNDRVVPVRAIVGDEDGEGFLALNPSHHGDHQVAMGESPAGAQRVRQLTLDRFVREELSSAPVCFLKIDVQGYEPNVLRGAARVLASNPGIAISTEADIPSLRKMGFTTADLFSPLRQAGFQPNLIGKEGELERTEENAIEAVLARGRYVNLIWRRPA